MPHYERALALDPGHAGAHYNLGVAVAALGRIADAVAHYRRSLAIDSGKRGRPLQPRNCACRAGQQDRCGTSCTTRGRSPSIPIPPRLTTTLDLFSINRVGMKDAVAHLARAVVLSPDNITIRNTLSGALAAQGRFDDAVLHLSACADCA